MNGLPYPKGGWAARLCTAERGPGREGNAVRFEHLEVCIKQPSLSFVHVGLLKLGKLCIRARHGQTCGSASLATWSMKRVVKGQCGVIDNWLTLLNEEH